MRHFKIKKRKNRKPVFIWGNRGSLANPKFPRIIFWKINKPEFFVEFTFKN